MVSNGTTQRPVEKGLFMNEIFISVTIENKEEIHHFITHLTFYKKGLRNPRILEFRGINMNDNSVDIWNLLFLSRRLIICTEQRGIYVSTFA